MQHESGLIRRNTVNFSCTIDVMHSCMVLHPSEYGKLTAVPDCGTAPSKRTAVALDRVLLGQKSCTVLGWVPYRTGYPLPYRATMMSCVLTFLYGKPIC